MTRWVIAYPRHRRKCR